MSRVTWLAKEKKNAGIYDDKGITNKECIVLEIDFPEIKKWDNWQMTCYEPISLERIKLLRD